MSQIQSPKERICLPLVIHKKGSHPMPAASTQAQGTALACLTSLFCAEAAAHAEPC